MLQHVLLLCHLLCISGLTFHPHPWRTTRRAIGRAQTLCATEGESDEVARARQRRDEQALQSEWEDGLTQNAVDRDTQLREDELKMLRERINLVETKEVCSAPCVKPPTRRLPLPHLHLHRRSSPRSRTCYAGWARRSGCSW